MNTSSATSAAAAEPETPPEPPAGPLRIAITGVTGRLGSALARGLADAHQVIPLDRAALDLARPGDLPAALAGIRFDLLINPAALTSPDAAEADPELARRVNALAPGVLAACCRQRGARMLHLSTDYVFGGRRPGLRGERCRPDPRGAYGRTKHAGELAVIDAHPAACIVRVSWLYGGGRPGFPEQVVARARARTPLAAIADKFSLPTRVDDLVAWIRALVAAPEVAGIVHACPSGPPASWRDWALATLEAAVAAGRLDRLPPVAPLRLAEAGFFHSPRPRHTAMANRRLAALLGTAPGDWRDALRAHVASSLQAPGDFTIHR